ncbi:MAG: alpha/beta hydrolase [Saprospiraceae bacterium]|nr:alpha/beta hydrolase [Saprospiraceae bacterium]
MTAKEFYWTTKDGIDIFGKEWPLNDPKAVIGLVHGLGEHISRYDHVATFLNEKGYAVVGYDRRGHGQSGGKRGHAPSLQALLEEIDGLLAQCKKRYPNLPVIFYGHSMGGCLVLSHALRQKSSADLVISSAPWIQLGKPPAAALESVARLINRVFPAFAIPNGLDPKQISKDEKEVKAYTSDPLVHNKISVGCAVAMDEAASELDQFKGAFPVPVLVLHGAEDQITSPKASKGFTERLSSEKQYELIPDSYHEIHNDFHREEVFSVIQKWLEKQLKTV